MSESNRLLYEIAEKLNYLVRLSAIQIAEGKTPRDQIQVLSSAGFGPKDIASLLGTTSNTVSVTLSQIRKKDRRKRGHGKPRLG